MASADRAECKDEQGEQDEVRNTAYECPEKRCGCEDASSGRGSRYWGRCWAKRNPDSQENEQHRANSLNECRLPQINFAKTLQIKGLPQTHKRRRIRCLLQQRCLGRVISIDDELLVAAQPTCKEQLGGLERCMEIVLCV